LHLVRVGPSFWTSRASLFRILLNPRQDLTFDVASRAQHYSSHISSKTFALTSFLLAGTCPKLAISSHLRTLLFGVSEFHGVKASITAVALRILDTKTPPGNITLPLPWLDRFAANISTDRHSPLSVLYQATSRDKLRRILIDVDLFLVERC
jgi:hypothetical protein